jgi:hypothetical protein
MYFRLPQLVYAAALSVLISISPASLQAMPGMSGAQGGNTIAGTVKETMDASGYTYLLVAQNNGDVWVAIPETAVNVGDKVNYFTGMEMKNFTSKTLDRTFSSIIFSSGLAEGGIKSDNKPAADADDSFAAAIKAERSAPSAAAPIDDAAASGGSAGAIVPLAEIAIEKSTAENGYSVGEIFEKATELNGKKVLVKGKVMKVSPAIMGRNWIHIQDGSGNPMKNSHDLVITTSEMVELDDVVTFEGVLAAKKDFGAGYKYEAIVEEATLLK